VSYLPRQVTNCLINPFYGGLVMLSFAPELRMHLPASSVTSAVDHYARRRKVVLRTPPNDLRTASPSVSQ
jgi:hypothetical protein